VEQIARDTHIARRFLEALESEDFDAFPGEPYLLGFLRKYSEHLGLNPEETVALYHNMQLQEQPPPIDELIVKKPSLPIGRVLIIAAIVIAVGVVAYLLFFTRAIQSDPQTASRPDPEPAATAEPAVSPDRSTAITGEIIEQRFVEGETVTVSVDETPYVIEIDDVSDVLTLSYEGESVEIPIGQEFPLDLNTDEQTDVRVLVRQLDTDSSPATVVMRWDRGTGAMAEIPAIEPAERLATTPAVGSTTEPAREQSARVVSEFTDREEINIEVRFEGYALFRYEADNDDRVEQYFQAGETFVTSVQDRFKLWTSNAASVRLRVAGQDIGLGDSGEVTAALITWVPDEESGNELLEIVPVY
jgi:cytoskeletal protein RodZ